MKHIWIVLLLCLPGALLAADPVQFKVLGDVFVPGESLSTTIEGTWRNGCAPRVGDIMSDENNIYFHAESTGGICTQALTPYSLEYEWPVPATFSKYGFVRLHFVVSEPGREDQSYGFYLLPRKDAPAYRPEAGLWWQDEGGEFMGSGPGTGFNLDFQNDVLVMMANSYGEDGQPNWYLLAGEFKRNVINQDLLKFSNGQYLFGDYMSPSEMQTAGQAHLAFNTATEAELWLQSHELDSGGVHLQAISLTREVFGAENGASALLGKWLEVHYFENVSAVHEFTSLEINDEAGVINYRNEAGEVLMQCFSDAVNGNKLPRSCLTPYEYSHPRVQFATQPYYEGVMVRGVDRIGGEPEYPLMVRLKDD